MQLFNVHIHGLVFWCFLLIKIWKKSKIRPRLDKKEYKKKEKKTWKNKYSNTPRYASTLPRKHSITRISITRG